MKSPKSIWILVTVISVLLLYFFFVQPAIKANREAYNRAELQMLRAIENGVSAHLDAGGRLPTDWTTLSNSLDFKLPNKIWGRNHSIPLSEAYVVLARPVTNRSGSGGVFFLVGSKPCNWPARGVGRWLLAAWPDPPPQGWFNSDFTNRVVRVWLPEDYMPAEIRSQLTNQP